MKKDERPCQVGCSHRLYFCAKRPRCQHRQPSPFWTPRLFGLVLRMGLVASNHNSAPIFGCEARTYEDLWHIPKKWEVSVASMDTWLPCCSSTVPGGRFLDGQQKKIERNQRHFLNLKIRDRDISLRDLFQNSRSAQWNFWSSPCADRRSWVVRTAFSISATESSVFVLSARSRKVPVAWRQKSREEQRLLHNFFICSYTEVALN